MADAQPPQEPPVPDEKTVAAAVSVLQFELGLLNGAIDSLDRKAVLIPTFLVAAAAFLLGPVGTSYNSVQVVLIAGAFATGIASAFAAYRAMAPGSIKVGPKAEIVERHTSAPIAPFSQRIVESLSDAIQETTRRTLVSADRLDRGLKLAGITLVLLVLVRLAGGLALADNPQNAPSSPPAMRPSASPSPAAPPTPTQAPASPGPTAPSTPPPASEQQLPSFEAQIAYRDAVLPSFEQQIAAKGGQLSDAERAIIEKGG